MSDDKNKDENLPEPPGKAEEIKGPGDQKKDTAEIKLREIPGLAELEVRRQLGKGKKSSATFFTLVLVILFGFTVIVYLMDKYRDESYMGMTIEEKTTLVETSGSSVKAPPPAVRPASGKEGPKKYMLAGAKLSGEARLQVRAKGPLISDDKDPEVAAVGEALRARVEMLNGVKIKRARRGDSITETTAGVFLGFRVNSTRIKSGDQVTKDEIIVTTPSRGIFVVRNNVLDAWRNCDYEKILGDLQASGIKVIKKTDPERGIVNVQLRVTAAGNVTIDNDLLISRQKVGRLELDMTIRQMKSVFPVNYGYVKKRIEYDNEFYNIIKVFDDKGTPLFFVNEKDNKVWGIQIISGKYKTGKGIGVGSTLGSLKIYYPKPRIWSTRDSAPLVSVEGITGVFILQNVGVDFVRQIFPDNVKIDSILIGGSPFLK